ncbi:uncharacterized protein PITG_15107 [Phytophthora infestans T30-4]|uniref:Uncharacterized protein n=1 Tax=Phytophthora infestans (strain T30-4) TaxID=403677 RepID=D0NRP0_PHYIT|nr:uncharacterized protein PITG_15107 [Phytophthora infestans T30-4]EEY63390.1 hypothetical protein PITG_15107 [Phytophthora infestans T30-4]|eukprot:XP_002898275.1 hypothetical protein PITG_15107 [Phytophthora infestans T30-4]
MLATLGIKKDNDSNEDFVLERSDDEDVEGNLDDFDPEPETTNESVKKRRFSPHEVLPLQKKHKGGESRDSLRGDVVDDSGGANITEYVEYTPRKRTSKHVDELEAMAVSCDKVVSVVVTFPSVEISSWEEFNNVFSEHKRKNQLNFRVRSSETTVAYTL